MQQNKHSTWHLLLASCGVEGISRTKRNTKRIYAGTITVGQRDVLAMECQSPTEWSRLIENLP